MVWRWGLRKGTYGRLLETAAEVGAARVWPRLQVAASDVVAGASSMEAGVGRLLMRALARADGVCRRIRIGACRGRVVGQPPGTHGSCGGSRVNLLAPSGCMGGANELVCASRVEKGSLGVIKCFDCARLSTCYLAWNGKDSALCR